MKSFKHQWILITGASSGLGLAMAKILSEKYEANLILVARREDRLLALQREIQSHVSVEVDTMMADLQLTADTQRVIDYCLAREGFCGAILNAGMTYLGEHHRAEEDQISNILSLNILSTTQMATHFVRHFERSGKPGTLLAISSLAAHYPTPYQALYSGTKGYITNFMNSLAFELKNPALRLCVFTPGGIKTEMTAVEGFKDLEKWLMPVETAAREAVRCFIQGKHNYIPGVQNRIAFTLMKLLPLKWISAILGKQYRKSLEL